MQKEMTNLELETALRKLLENQKKQAKEIAELKALFAEKPEIATRKKPGSPIPEIELPEGWEYPTITAKIAAAVVSSRSLPDAAASLLITRAELDNLLLHSEIIHPYSEKWSVTMKRALGYGPQEIKPIKVPEDWPGKSDKILERVRQTGLKATADWIGVGGTNLLGRFLWDNGYDTKGQPLKKKKKKC
jgi:hypothetical protein